MDKNKIILWTVTFIVSIAVGYAISKLLFTNNNDDEMVVVPSSSPNISNPDFGISNEDVDIHTPKEDDFVSVAPIKEEEPKTEIESSPKRDIESGNSTNLGDKYENIEKANNNDAAANIASVNKMSAVEFQRLLLDQNDSSLLGGMNHGVAKRVSIIVRSLNEGDRKPEDILAVRDKIANGIWVSAIVNSVNYDSQGKINSIVISPIYPD